MSVILSLVTCMLSRFSALLELITVSTANLHSVKLHGQLILFSLCPHISILKRAESPTIGADVTLGHVLNISVYIYE